MKKLLILLFFFIKINYSFADNNITYIDINFILSNSLVGKSINKHITKIQDENIKKFNEQEKEFNDKEQKLLSQKNILDKQKFQFEANILNEEIKKYKNDKNKILKKINDEKIKYTKEVLNYLNPIITEFVEKNSISIVLPKKNIVVGKKDLDITEDIIILLNNKVKEINF
tara:strand:- start:302 stop:814 length:513 start_codon:yes stop_codon:yes gene_type:complete